MTAIVLPILILTIKWHSMVPPQVLGILHTSYPSYAPVEPTRSLALTFKVDHPQGLTWLARGDFDGDGQEDLALLLECDRAGRKRRIVLAFLKRGDAYLPVYAGQGHDFILTIKKGATGFDFLTDSHFYYERDAIYTETFERAGESLIWLKGRFVSRPTAD